MKKILHILFILGLLTACNKKHVLESFMKAKDTTANNHSLDSAVSRRFNDLELEYNSDPKYLKPVYIVSLLAVKTSDCLIKQIEVLKLILITRELVLSRKEVLMVPRNNKADSLAKTLTTDEWLDDINPKKILTIDKIGDMTQEEHLKMIITNYRNKMISLFDTLHANHDNYPPAKDTARMDIGLLFPARFIDGDGTKHWTCFSFAPLVTDVIQLNQLQNAIRKTELCFLDYFYSSISVD